MKPVLIASIGALCAIGGRFVFDVPLLFHAGVLTIVGAAVSNGMALRRCGTHCPSLAAVCRDRQHVRRVDLPAFGGAKCWKPLQRNKWEKQEQFGKQCNKVLIDATKL